MASTTIVGDDGEEHDIEQVLQAIIRYVETEATQPDGEPLTAAQQAALIPRLTWQMIWARPEQLWPPHDPDVVAWQGGRGSGKTRPAAEKMSEWAQDHAKTRWAVVAPTLGACRAVCFEGDSGLLAVLPKTSLYGGTVERAFNRSQLTLKLANQSVIQGYGSERPGRLRGPQHHGWWIDEPAELKDADALPMEVDTTFSNLVLGARLTTQSWLKVRGLISGTPKPVRLLAGNTEVKGILNGYEDLEVHVERMSSRDNLANLAPIYRTLVDNLSGTRMGLQEIEGQLIDEVEGAMIRPAWIILEELPEEFYRIVVGVDPAGSTKKSSDETGIVVTGMDQDGYYWALEDLTGKYTPSEWAHVAWEAHERWGANGIIVERNFGGDMVKDTITRHSGAPASIVKEVNASRGKVQRFEPVSFLYEPSEAFPSGRVRHAERMPELVDELTSFTKDSTWSPNRFDAHAWGILWLSKHEASNASGEAGDYLSAVFGKRGTYW